MIDSLPPGVILIVGALLIPLLPGRWKSFWLLVLPVLSALHLVFGVAEGTQVLPLFGYNLMPVHVDRLSLMWGYMFHIAAFLCALYAFHLRDSVQHVSALVYAGAAIGAVFAGDLLTLFVFWEMTAISAVFLIWANGTERSYRAGMRYLIIQVTSGVVLLAGIVIHLNATGSMAFTHPLHSVLPASDAFYRGLNSPGSVLIFVAFGIKAAFPLLHAWLPDAYPEGTVTGTVFLSAFTTKLAIYALARGFPGTEMLVSIGAAMAVLPIVFAILANDLRRVLAYSLMTQLGFMVVGIGLADLSAADAKLRAAAEMALNGAASHAFASTIYQTLLFMTMGAVLYRTGTIRGTDLGGMYKSMPWTATFCIAGAASISSVPLFSGFVTKSMTLSAAAELHQTAAWVVLLAASASAFLHTGLKIPWTAFFGTDSGWRVAEAPPNMLLAMGISASLCVGIGVVSGPLYGILPFAANYQAYTTSHIVTQLQLLCFVALALVVSKRLGFYPALSRSVVLDSDWFYRKLLPTVVGWLYRVGAKIRAAVVASTLSCLDQILAWIAQRCGPTGTQGRSWSTSGMVVWASVLLAGYLALYYL